MEKLVKEHQELNRAVADEDFEKANSESRLMLGLTAKKIYGNAIYVQSIYDAKAAKLSLTQDELNTIKEIQKYFYIDKERSIIEAVYAKMYIPDNMEGDRYDAYKDKLSNFKRQGNRKEIKISCDFQEGCRSLYNRCRNIDRNILEKLNPLIKMFKTWEEEIG